MPPHSISRRLLLSGALAATSSGASALGSATMRAPYAGASAPVVETASVPVAVPGAGWTGFQSASNTGVNSGFAANPYTLDRSLRGNGPEVTYPWRQRSTCNIAEPDGMWIDPASNEVVVMGSSGDPNLIATMLQEVVVIVEGGTPVVIPGWKFEIGAHGVPGYRVRLGQGPSHAGKWGPVNVKAITRPYNGYEKSVTKTFILDEFGAAGRQTYYVAPSSYSGAVASGTAAQQIIAAKNPATPFATINRALSTLTPTNGASYGPFVNLLAGTHLVDDTGTGTGNENLFMATVQADAGLTKAQVSVDCTSPLTAGNQFLIKLTYDAAKDAYPVYNQVFYARNLLLQGLTLKWTNFGATRLFSGKGSGRYYFRDVQHTDDNGATGLSTDPLNTDPYTGQLQVDPDTQYVDPNTGQTRIDPHRGGFGYFGAGALDYTLGGNDGTLFAFMECYGMEVPCVKSLNVDSFRRNMSVTTGGDVVAIGANSSRKRVADDGLPQLDIEDLLYVNLDVSMPCKTPWKGRFHDQMTIAIESMLAIPNPTDANGTLDIVGMQPLRQGETVGHDVSTSGFTIVTWKTTGNDAAQTPVLFQKFFYNGADNIIRFMNGALAQKGDTTNVNGRLGWQIYQTGKAMTVTINGVDYNIAANQSVIRGDITATPFGSAQVGDRVTALGLYHSDPLQYTGTSLGGPNHRNHIYWNYRAAGPGIGNMILLSNGQIDSHQVSTDAAGNFALANGLPSCRLVHNLYGGINFTSPPSVYEGVTAQAGDRILCTQNQFSQEKSGIYIYNGVGQPLTRSSDTLQKGSLVRVTEGASAGTLYRLDLAAASLTTFTLDVDKIYFNTCTLFVYDSFTAQIPGTTGNKFVWAQIETLNADGFSGKLNRPLVNAAGTPVAFATQTMTRVKGLVDSAFINVVVQSANLGQVTGSSTNVHFLYCSMFLGILVREGNYQAPQDFTIRGSGFGNNGVSLFDTDPRRSYYLIDNVLQNQAYGMAAIKGWEDALSKTPVATLVQSEDAYTLQGTTRRIIAPVVVPLDIRNNPRAVGGLLGVAAA